MFLEYYILIGIKAYEHFLYKKIDFQENFSTVSPRLRIGS